MELWTALVIGLAGSLHCIGMCGPIVLALPSGRRSAFWTVIGRLAYNFGRVVTYAFLGLLCGFVGRTVSMAGYQQMLSIVLGVLLLLAVLLPSRYGKYITGAPLHGEILALFRRFWSALQKRSSVPSLFGIGILNGFLPCGLVYVALAGSLATAAPLKSAVYMAMFGLGTVPVMLATAIFGNFAGLAVKRRLYKLLPVGVVVLAAVLILRGLSLGIPLISPKIVTTDQQEVTMDCCHGAEQTIENPGE
ncbi:sulfite exporter TauE/SafE family protein [bacterium]|nr:sulfite exporter TauE/SafE family protein [bacterium]